jgi:hypothetical protein
MRRPLVIYDFAGAPLWISLYMRKILFFKSGIFFEGLPPERESPLHQVLQGLSPGDPLLAQHTLHHTNHIRYSYRFGR